jgi:hypothetical protein
MGFLDAFRSKKSNKPSIAVILITQMVSENQSLMILLGSDGFINRMGTGSEHRLEKAMFIGKTSTDAFNEVADYSKPIIKRWIGAFSDPAPVGKTCILRVGFQIANGEELMSHWQYGAESQGPPPDVMQLVATAINATNPWYEAQKAMVKKRQEQK